MARTPETPREAVTTLALARPDRSRAIPIPNFRDVGGHATRDGRVVRRGLLFRSTDLARITDDAAAALADLGIRTVFDLRTDDERLVWPELHQIPAGADCVVADVLRDAPEETPARMLPLLASPDTAAEVLGNGRAERLFLHKYREFINLTSARQAYHRFLSDLALPANLPAVLHCTTGKDRTGWAVAILLLLLGVPEDVVMDDYLASNVELEAMNRDALARFAAIGGDPQLLEPLLCVRRQYLEAALDEMRRGFGSIDGYVDAGLAIGPLTRRHLLASFLEPT